MDNQPNTEELKYKNWVLTVSPTKSFEIMSPDDLKKILTQVAEAWVFQEEKATVTHYQCCLRMPYRVRHNTLLSRLEELYLEGSREIFTLDRMRSEWNTAILYCTKEETRVSGPYFSDMTLRPYEGTDVDFMYQRENRHPWQNQLLNILLEPDETTFKVPDDRTIYWVTDFKGCTGKSKLVKYLYLRYPSVAEVTFGSSNQLRTALISIGPKTLYFVDIPRTLGEEDSMNTLLSVIEKLKGGFLTSTMYGKYTSLMMNPPHIVIFSNQFPKISSLSADRWKILNIIDLKFYEENPHSLP